MGGVIGDVKDDAATLTNGDDAPVGKGVIEGVVAALGALVHGRNASPCWS